MSADKVFKMQETPEMTDVSKMNVRLTAKFAKLNKKCELADYYYEVFAEEEYYENQVKVMTIAKFNTESGYIEFANNLMTDRDWMTPGGNDSDYKTKYDDLDDDKGYIALMNDKEEFDRWKAQSFVLGTMIISPSGKAFVIDSQGYKYARYVGLTDNLDRELMDKALATKIEKNKKEEEEKKAEENKIIEFENDLRVKEIREIDKQGRTAVTKEIKKALKERSGKEWSVTGDRGTAWAWINITAPKKRLIDYGYMTDDDRTELAKLLGLSDQVHCQGVSFSGQEWEQYLSRAKYGQNIGFKNADPYWD